VSVSIAILALALLALVVFVVSAPLRAANRESAQEHAADAPPQDGVSSPLPDLHELHAQRDAKYREIRDAELDFRTGKLSQEDYAAIDAQLRAEALYILNRLAVVEEGDPPLRSS
jgi:hypothetical protein